MTDTELDKTKPFPMEWNEWRNEWDKWKNEQMDNGRLTKCSYKFNGVNFMADEVLGVFGASSHAVELSEVTFLGKRMVGITYGAGSGNWVPDCGPVGTWAELEAELWPT